METSAQVPWDSVVFWFHSASHIWLVNKYFETHCYADFHQMGCCRTDLQCMNHEIVSLKVLEICRNALGYSSYSSLIFSVNICAGFKHT
jgi:hypothetical protein